MHFVLFNMNFYSAWLFNSLKFLLLLPVPTMPDDNDLFVNGFAFQARLILKHNTQLSQQEMFAPKYAFRSWYWLRWKHPAKPQLWKQLEDQENLTLPLSPASAPSFADHHRRGKPVGESADFPGSQGVFMDLTLAGVDFKCLQSTPGYLRLKCLVEKQKLFFQS